MTLRFTLPYLDALQRLSFNKNSPRPRPVPRNPLSSTKRLCLRRASSTTSILGCLHLYPCIFSTKTPSMQAAATSRPTPSRVTSLSSYQSMAKELDNFLRHHLPHGTFSSHHFPGWLAASLPASNFVTLLYLLLLGLASMLPNCLRKCFLRARIWTGGHISRRCVKHYHWIFCIGILYHLSLHGLSIDYSICSTFHLLPFRNHYCSLIISSTVFKDIIWGFPSILRFYFPHRFPLTNLPEYQFELSNYKCDSMHASFTLKTLHYRVR